ncbi:IS711, transposase orfA [Brucella sp. 10RB9215]|nr:IS711, transposase orfA [Brucella sp. 10RB9215]
MQRTGAICLRPSANGQRFMPAFGAGRTPVYGKGFSMPWLIRRTLNMSSLTAPYRKSTQMRRAQKGAEAACIGRSRGGLTTKLHAVVDAIGLPLRIKPTPGHYGDCPQASSLLSVLLGVRPENGRQIKHLLNRVPNKVSHVSSRHEFVRGRQQQRRGQSIAHELQEEMTRGQRLSRGIGLATHVGPEPCVGVREDVGRRVHRPAIEPRNIHGCGCRRCSQDGRQYA